MQNNLKDKILNTYKLFIQEETVLAFKYVLYFVYEPIYKILFLPFILLMDLNVLLLNIHLRHHF